MLLCLPVVGPTLPLAREQLERISSLHAMAELRIDLFDHDVLPVLKSLIVAASVPVLVTLRSRGQGGEFDGDENARWTLLRHLTDIHPELLDVELGTPLQELEELQRISPNTRIVVSYHNFEYTPDDLSAVLHRMQQLPAYAYKIATKAHSSVDALRMLNFSNSVNSAGGRLCGICMGSDGAPTRLLAAAASMPFTFGCLDGATTSAPGQVAYKELQGLYRALSLNPSAPRLGLLGDPIDKSRGFYVHNKTLAAMDLEGIYVNMRTEVLQLEDVLAELRQLGWRGLSVTMPLKEAIVPLLDRIDPAAEAIGAVNTVVFENNRLIGYNTDGSGALDAIKGLFQSDLKGKSCIILGAGGTAKAIAYQLHQAGGEVTLVNRDVARAQDAANSLGANFAGFDELPRLLRAKPDVLVNATSVGMAPNIDATLVNAEDLSTQTLVFDVVNKPRETRLLREARAKGCKTLDGRDLWIHQGARQLRLWYGDRIKYDDLIDLLTHEMNASVSSQ